MFTQVGTETYTGIQKNNPLHITPEDRASARKLLHLYRHDGQAQKFKEYLAKDAERLDPQVQLLLPVVNQAVADLYNFAKHGEPVTLEQRRRDKAKAFVERFDIFLSCENAVAMTRSGTNPGIRKPSGTTCGFVRIPFLKTRHLRP